jgi:hypothetical protein
MRLALKLVLRSLSLSWGYAPVASFDRSLFYRDLMHTLKTGACLPSSQLSLVADPRNLATRWLAFRTPLTPLLAGEKKSITGFDLRLAGLKGPKIIKHTRRTGVALYPELSAARRPLGLRVSPISSYVGQGPGWGAQSSRSLAYFRGTSFLGFKKAARVGFFSLGYLPSDILVAHRKDLRGGETTKPLVIPCGHAFVSADVNFGGSFLIERSFFEAKGGGPDVPNAPVDIESLHEGWDDHLS